MNKLLTLWEVKLVSSMFVRMNGLKQALALFALSAHFAVGMFNSSKHLCINNAILQNCFAFSL